MTPPLALTGARPRSTTLLSICRRIELPALTEQYYFAASIGKKFTAAIAFTEYKVLVEVIDDAYLHDFVKMQVAAKLGYFFCPYTPEQVSSGFAIDDLIDTLFHHGWRPKT